MIEFVVKPSNYWGEYHNVKCSGTKRRLIAKTCLQQSQLLDHSCVFVFKLRGQRGRARETQTFLVSYTHHPPAVIEADPMFLMSGLRVYSEASMFQGLPANMVVLYDREVDVACLLEHFRPDIAHESWLKYPGGCIRRPREAAETQETE
jgi:hypothetical protein